MTAGSIWRHPSQPVIGQLGEWEGLERLGGRHLSISSTTGCQCDQLAEHFCWAVHICITCCQTGDSIVDWWVIIKPAGFASALWNTKCLQHNIHPDSFFFFLRPVLGNSSSMSWCIPWACPVNVVVTRQHAAVYSLRDVVWGKTIRQRQPLCKVFLFSVFFLQKKIINPGWQTGNGGWDCGRPLCFYFTMSWLQKQVISLWSDAKGNSRGGQCGGDLIMETKVSRDKSIFLSNRGSPLPPVFLCLMHRLIRNWKSGVCCSTDIKSTNVEWCPVSHFRHLEPKISLKVEMISTSAYLWCKTYSNISIRWVQVPLQHPSWFIK